MLRGRRGSECSRLLRRCVYARAPLAPASTDRRRPRRVECGLTEHPDTRVPRREHLGGRLNVNPVLPHFVSAGFDGTKPAKLALLHNPVFSAPPLWEYVSEGQSVLEIARGDAIITASGGRKTAVLSSAKSGAAELRLTEPTRLTSGDIIALVASPSSGLTDVTGSLAVIED